jgi:hypothetical protein
MMLGHEGGGNVTAIVAAIAAKYNKLEEDMEELRHGRAPEA